MTGLLVAVLVVLAVMAFTLIVVHEQLGDIAGLLDAIGKERKPEPVRSYDYFDYLHGETKESEIDVAKGAVLRSRDKLKKLETENAQAAAGPQREDAERRVKEAREELVRLEAEETRIVEKLRKKTVRHEKEETVRRQVDQEVELVLQEGLQLPEHFSQKEWKVRQLWCELLYGEERGPLTAEQVRGVVDSAVHRRVHGHSGNVSSEGAAGERMRPALQALVEEPELAARAVQSVLAAFAANSDSAVVGARNEVQKRQEQLGSTLLQVGSGSFESQQAASVKQVTPEERAELAKRLEKARLATKSAHREWFEAVVRLSHIRKAARERQAKLFARAVLKAIIDKDADSPEEQMGFDENAPLGEILGLTDPRDKRKA